MTSFFVTKINSFEKPFHIKGGITLTVKISYRRDCIVPGVQIP